MYRSNNHTSSCCFLDISMPQYKQMVSLLWESETSCTVGFKYFCTLLCNQIQLQIKSIANQIKINCKINCEINCDQNNCFLLYYHFILFCNCSWPLSPWHGQSYTELQDKQHNQQICMHIALGKCLTSMGLSKFCSQRIWSGTTWEASWNNQTILFNAITTIAQDRCSCYL